MTRDFKKSAVREYFESIVIAVILALFIRTFVVQAFKIPTGSMEENLLIGDHLLVNKFIFGGHGPWYEKFLPYRPVRQGDVIVFKFPFDDHPHYVKRVVGLPGDKLSMARSMSTARACTSLTWCTIPPTKIPLVIIFRP